jgi:HPr kinase/phosphorylase
VLAVDMERVETERLPPRREISLLGRKVSLLHKVENAHFPAAILQYLKRGRSA